MDDEAKIRSEIVAAVDAVRAEKEDTGTPEPLSGCCYLQRGTVRECFNNFSASECERAARSCGCTHQHVPGGRCP